MRLTLLTLPVLLLALTACRAEVEARRQRMRDDAKDSSPFGSGSRAERIDANMAVLSESDAGGRIPALRAQAAANLGLLRAEEARELLTSRAFSRLADSDAEVRRECVIALTKLPVDSPLDPRRTSLVETLANRVAFDTAADNSGRLLERELRVRQAMLDAIITLGVPTTDRLNEGWVDQRGTLGYRDCAAALQRILQRLDSLRTGTTDLTRAPDIDGRANGALAEASIQGLLRLTGTPATDSDLQRRSPDRAAYHRWWLTRVEAMPRMDSFASAPTAQ